MRKIATKKWVSITLRLGTIASIYLGFKAMPVGQVDSSTYAQRTTVPAPLQGQKKVVLKSLGMA